MNNNRLLVVAMAEQCRRLIQEWKQPTPDLAKALQPKHLLWMCSMIEDHAEDSPVSKLNRWIGFIQAAILANRMLGLPELKAMFDDAKRAYGETSEDLTDHLDPTSTFKFDIGGQG